MNTTQDDVIPQTKPCVASCSTDDFLIVIPALNEALTIGKIVQEALFVTPNVCVIDDGSSDDTSSISRRVGATVITHEKTLGLGGAFRSAFNYAETAGFCHVITLDGDGAHDPAFCRQLFDLHINARADLTIGSRLLTPPSALDMPTSKVAANLFAASLMNACLETDIRDVASGMRVISKRLFSIVPEVLSFAISFELIRVAHGRGMKIVEHPINVRYDASELLATSRNELIDLLAFCEANTTSQTLRKVIEALLQRARSFLPFSARCSQGTIFAHPLANDNAYLFQVQNQWFDYYGANHDCLPIAE